MTQDEAKQLVKDLVNKQIGTVIQFHDDTTRKKEVIIIWRNPLGHILRVQLSNTAGDPNEVRFFFNDDVRCPYYRNILFDNKKSVLPSKFKKYLSEKGNNLFQNEITLFGTDLQDIIQSAILDEESDWCII